jgi:hypothetical protein
MTLFMSILMALLFSLFCSHSSLTMRTFTVRRDERQTASGSRVSLNARKLTFCARNAGRRYRVDALSHCFSIVNDSRRWVSIFPLLSLKSLTHTNISL